MSAELKEVKVRLTPEAKALLDAHARVTGKDRGEIVREIVQQWAEEQLHIATVADGLLRAEGLGGIARGVGGNRRENEGTSGSCRDGEGARGHGGRR